MKKLLSAVVAALLAFSSVCASAANRAAWTAGNGVGYTWTTAINGSDLVSLASGSTALSSVADITNQTAQDIYADVSVELTIASSTPAAGAVLYIYVVPLQQDGTTYGDGELASGGAMARAYPFAPVCSIPLETAVATTLLAGFCQGIVIPPGSFRFALNNGSTITLSATAANNVVKYRTYNIQLNN
jgi:hypothetical protein